MIRRPPRSTLSSSSAASDVYKRQLQILLNECCGNYGSFDKIIILFDEFGRFLEYASANPGRAGDSALQQIFEAVQNAEGDIQFIGFIQADIKAYLQRVDKSSNISRYIDRFDASDKVYLSSNLETIFANLIEVKNSAMFQSCIANYFSTHQTEIQDIYPVSYTHLTLPTKRIV